MVANLAVLPGLGSLAAHRRVGYAQAALAIVGAAMTTLFAWWAAQELWHALSTQHSTAEALLLAIHPFDYPRQYGIGLGGIALFAISWLWALATSLSLRRELQAAETPDHVR